MLSFGFLLSGVLNQPLAQGAQSKSKLKSVLVLAHGTSNGHRASTDDLVAALKDLATKNSFEVTVLPEGTNTDVAFQTANLAKYQVVIFSNNDGVDKYISTGTKTNIENFVNGGGGLVAIHAASAFIGNWTWYHNALVREFTGPHQSNGPTADLNLDAEGLKTGEETYGILKGLPPSSVDFRDEYYQFTSTPRGQSGVTILVTVDEATSSAPFSSPMGRDHPVVWAKPIGKGRIVHHSLGHSFGSGGTGHNVYTHKNNYLHDLMLRILKYSAGDYIGCTDSTYEQYNPDATKNDQTACLNKIPVSILVNNSVPKSFEFSQLSKNNSIEVNVLATGPHSVAIVDMAGKVVDRRNGSGPVQYSLPSPQKSGFYLVKVKTNGKIQTQRISVL